MLRTIFSNVMGEKTPLYLLQTGDENAVFIVEIFDDLDFCRSITSYIGEYVGPHLLDFYHAWYTNRTDQSFCTELFTVFAPLFSLRCLSQFEANHRFILEQNLYSIPFLRMLRTHYHKKGVFYTLRRTPIFLLESAIACEQLESIRFIAEEYLEKHLLPSDILAERHACFACISVSTLAIEMMLYHTKSGKSSIIEKILNSIDDWGICSRPGLAAALLEAYRPCMPGRPWEPRDPPVLPSCVADYVRNTTFHTLTSSGIDEIMRVLADNNIELKVDAFAFTPQLAPHWVDVAIAPILTSPRLMEKYGRKLDVVSCLSSIKPGEYASLIAKHLKTYLGPDKLAHFLQVNPYRQDWYELLEGAA